MSFVVIARWTAAEGQEETVAGFLRELTAASRAEPGCEQYVAHRTSSDERRFVIYEVYADEAAFGAHRDSAHFQRLAVDGALPLLSDRVVETCVPLDP